MESVEKWVVGMVKDRSSVIRFSTDKFGSPDPLWWPGYFWLWNGPLTPEVLLRQLRDMHAHDARSVCVIPMPQQFRPKSTNNQMDLEYLSPEFFQRIQLVVKEANRLGMNYWLYDEGGWPSGEACGQVLDQRPDLVSLAMQSDEEGNWRLAERPGLSDLLSQETTRTFLTLTHERYRKAVGGYFGTTIRFVFTDEPAVRPLIPGRQIPWTKGLEEEFARRFGYRIEEHLEVFRKLPETELTQDEMRVRVDFFDWWSERFRETYFDPLRKWCREHRLLSGGHLGGEDETLGAVKHGFGHVLRILRGMDLPGVDVIWRQIFPGKLNHNFPKYAATAAHQNGSSFAFTESFGVYGNGLRIEQMKWLVDYQYVRGINLLVIGCYPLSTFEHLMPGERPHFGPVNPLWDYMPEFHRYVARLGYALSCGEPAVETAVYYPVRDIWAKGTTDEAVTGYEMLIQTLLENQCDFDLIDDDVLSDPNSRFENGMCCVGPMRYRRVVIGPCQWLRPQTADRLVEFVRSGGELVCLDQLPGVEMDGGARLREKLGACVRLVKVGVVEELLQEIPPLVELVSPSKSIRVTARCWLQGALYFLFNEGEDPYRGSARFREAFLPKKLDPLRGGVRSVGEAYREDEHTIVPLELMPGESLLLLFDSFQVPRQPCWQSIPGAELLLAEGWQARSVRRFDVGRHDYEVRELPGQSWESIHLGAWRERFDDDFSGDVAYRISVDLPKSWQGLPLRLSLGKVEYAAWVWANGQEVGRLIWPPWEVDLSNVVRGERLELEIVITNTLANVLTSERVRRDWESQQGPGWPGPYHVPALEFEMESRGGGLYGPVRLQAFHHSACAQKGDLDV